MLCPPTVTPAQLAIWTSGIRPTEENSERVWRALGQFGAPRRNVTREDFCTPDTVYQIGSPPQRIDIMTSIDGVDFDEAWNARKAAVVEGLSLAFLGRDQLLKNKRATGRPKDLFDVAWMEESDE